jgi:hypothetical protein
MRPGGTCRQPLRSISASTGAVFARSATRPAVQENRSSGRYGEITRMSPTWSRRLFLSGRRPGTESAVLSKNYHPCQYDTDPRRMHEGVSRFAIVYAAMIRA